MFSIKRAGRIGVCTAAPTLTTKPVTEVPLALIPDKPENRSAQALADLAYDAHTALIHHEKENPWLGDNPYWLALRDAAYARFRAAMEKA